MNEMTERIARALATQHLALRDGEAFGLTVGNLWPSFVPWAQLAIMCMREPTAAMWAGAKPFMDSESSNAAWWRAMIEGALSEPG